MKKFTFLLLATFLMASSCKKESLNNCAAPDNVSLEGALTVKQGKFVFNSAKFDGIAKIYQQKNGRYVLGLEEMNITENMDFIVYLSKTSDMSSGSLKLFSARSIVGNRYYMLLPNFSITGFNFVFMRNNEQEIIVANAALN